jgi:hypothetical protein
MNSASCVGFAHFGDTAYILQTVSPDSRGMYLTNELAHLHNLASVFDEKLKTPNAMIFAGVDTMSVYEQITAKPAPDKRNYKGFTDYAEVYSRADVPISLLSCDDAGATQLAVMCQPAYRENIARAAFGERCMPDPDIPGADGCVNGKPLVIAVDMDVRRVLGVCAAAVRLGRREVMVAALREQTIGFYVRILPKGGIATPLVIGESILEKAFGKRVSLYDFERAPAVGGSGEYIYA